MIINNNSEIPSNQLGQRILLITHFLPPGHTAGTEQYTLGLGKALVARGYHVELLCAEDWDQGEHYWNGVTTDSLDGVSVHRIHLNWVKAKNPNKILYDSKPVEKWLDSFLADNRFDLVHVTSTYSLGVGVFRSVKRAKIPLVLTLMDFWFICPSLQLLQSDGNLCDGVVSACQCEACLMAGSHIFQELSKVTILDSIKCRFWDTLAHITVVNRQRGLRGMLLNMEQRKYNLKKALSLPDVIISPSNTVKDLFAKNTDRTIEFLPYRHDVSWLNTYHGKTKSDVIRIGYLGQIHQIKGLHLLVEAFVKAEIGDRARLVIWGDYTKNPVYAQKLHDIIGDHPSILLMGGYRREQMGSIMAEIDIVVVPSIWYENAPLVIQEAFAAKTPVITTNLGGMAEAIKHNVNGLLFERNDIIDLSQQLKRVVDEKNLLATFTSNLPSVKQFQNHEDEPLEIELVYRRLISQNQLPSVYRVI